MPLLAYITAFIVGSTLLFFDKSPVWVVLGAFISGVVAVIFTGLAYRRAVLRNTLGMIEAEALFRELKVAESIDFEQRRLRTSQWWDWIMPRLSMSMPVYVSLITKCLQTRRLGEAGRWIERLRGFTRLRRALHMARYFRMIHASLTGDLKELDRVGSEMRSDLNPAKDDDRSMLAQLAFVEAKWALRRNDLAAAERQIRAGHDLQPDLDLYYLLKSQLALANGDDDSAQNYAQSLATTRLNAPLPRAMVALEQLLPALRHDPDRFRTQIDQLAIVIEGERAKFRAQGVYQQLEVALYLRDSPLLERSVRELEQTACEHPSAKLRVIAGAAFHFAWEGDKARAIELAADGIALLDHPACADEDIAFGGLALGLLYAECGRAEEARRAAAFAEALPQFADNTHLRFVRDLIGFEAEAWAEGAAEAAASDAAKGTWRERFEAMRARSEAAALRAHLDAAAAHLGIVFPDDAPEAASEADA